MISFTHAEPRKLWRSPLPPPQPLSSHPHPNSEGTRGNLQRINFSYTEIKTEVGKGQGPFVLTGRAFPSQYLYKKNMETDFKNKYLFGEK